MKRGFTLIELLLCVVGVAFVFAVAGGVFHVVVSQKLQTRAVALGMGEYRADPKTGNVKFEWRNLATNGPATPAPWLSAVATNDGTAYEIKVWRKE